MNFKGSSRLSAEYWLLSNKPYFRKLFVFFVVGVDIVLATLVLLFYVNYFVAVQEQESIIDNFATSNTLFDEWTQNEEPEKINSLSVELVESAKGRYDFIAMIENTNQHWYSEKLEYKFVWGSEESEIKSVTLLPKEKKHILALNEKSLFPPSSVRLVIVNHNWKWTKDKYPTEYTNKDKFKIINTKTIQNEEESISKTEYKIKNETIFDFWKVDFNIILYQGREIVGLNHTYIEKFKSGETRKIENIWNKDFLGSTRIVVEPVINFLDSTNYMKSESQGEQK